MCASTAEGKQLSWGHNGERHKVATVDGTLFAKAGSITGGTASDMTSRAQRWDDKAYETLKQVSLQCSCERGSCCGPSELAESRCRMQRLG